MSRLGSRTYAEYLASPEWHIRRRDAINRANGHCQSPTCSEGFRRSLTAEELAELDEGGRFTLHIHHLTYDRIGAELPDDLIVLCENCHRSVHGLPPIQPSERGPISLGDAMARALKRLLFPAAPPNAGHTP